MPRDINILARKNRSNPTTTESILWEALRGKRLKGLKFRRQHPIGRYIVDFYCPSERLIIEIDGLVHDTEDHKDYDHVREREIRAQNLRMKRFSNYEVENRLWWVLSKIDEITG
ncbi:MAG: endonuclease domain-containing protein [bacterium]|nr:endonuclease domain-containing protein [bacterium]